MVHKYPLDTVHNYNMTTEDFLPVYDMIKVLDLDKKKKIKGLSAQRADILPAALSIIKAFVTYMAIENFTFSGAGLREGIMFNQALPSTLEKPISDVLNYSLTTLVKYYDCDEKHVEHVVNLSIQLFKQLRVLHKFPRQYLKVLKVAAMLHDCGMRIKFYNHQRHSMYMILNSTLYGVTHREIVLAAFVACCHKKEDINPYDWARYKDLLNDEDLEIVKRLGVMLRIAESLDRSMSGAIKGINCDILGDSVIMKTEVEGDASLEIRDALTASAEFKKSFHKNLEIL
jgi:exopolyphosphatase/guanosine-5'-triphosphate,3'-diphosphate pyrophosphatase